MLPGSLRSGGGATWSSYVWGRCYLEVLGLREALPGALRFEEGATGIS